MKVSSGSLKDRSLFIKNIIFNNVFLFFLQWYVCSDIEHSSSRVQSKENQSSRMRLLLRAGVKVSVLGMVGGCVYTNCFESLSRKKTLFVLGVPLLGGFFTDIIIAEERKKKNTEGNDTKNIVKKVLKGCFLVSGFFEYLMYEAVTSYRLNEKLLFVVPGLALCSVMSEGYLQYIEKVEKEELLDEELLYKESLEIMNFDILLLNKVQKQFSMLMFALKIDTVEGLFNFAWFLFKERVLKKKDFVISCYYGLKFKEIIENGLFFTKYDLDRSYFNKLQYFVFDDCSKICSENCFVDEFQFVKKFFDKENNDALKLACKKGILNKDGDYVLDYDKFKDRVKKKYDFLIKQLLKVMKRSENNLGYSKEFDYRDGVELLFYFAVFLLKKCFDEKSINGIEQELKEYVEFDKKYLEDSEDEDGGNYGDFVIKHTALIQYFVFEEESYYGGEDAWNKIEQDEFSYNCYCRLKQVFSLYC